MARTEFAKYIKRFNLHRIKVLSSACRPVRYERSRHYKILKPLKHGKRTQFAQNMIIALRLTNIMTSVPLQSLGFVLISSLLF